MNVRRLGKRTLTFPNRPIIGGWASAAGKKESEGPLSEWFDMKFPDTKLRRKSWEQAETRMQQLALERLLQKTGLTQNDLDVVFSGDLLNQCVGSSFALRNTGLACLGLYGACSTMAEGLLLAAAAVNAGYAERAAAMTSSHFASSERQYRFPLAYGGQRTPTAQWTVTGCGAVLVTSAGTGPRIAAATVGTIEDKGIKDANNMGAAMAWAACQTIRTHLDAMGAAPTDYDRIVTGDLGKLGSDLVRACFAREGLILGERYDDCGLLIFDRERQDVHCGGSGCGCSAAVLCGYLLGQMERKAWNRLLFCGTGALLSPTTVQQKQSIPAVCHCVEIVNS